MSVREPFVDKEATLAWLRSISGELATATLRRLDQTLPWYRDLPPARRSAVGLVAQAGITSFISWFDDPRATPWIAADVFGGAPRELLRSVSLQQTLQLIRVVVEVVEEHADEGGETLREAILLYSREIAFASADVYARAAETRGLWDARLEALVVDSILAGENDDELPSRVAALGWHGHGEVAVLVGTTPKQPDPEGLRRTARNLGSDALLGIQGSRLVVVLGRLHPRGETRPDVGTADVHGFGELAVALTAYFGDGELVVGPEVSGLVEASRSARAALSGFAVAHAWAARPRPVNADDLLPERAFASDPLARATLIERIHRPLRDHAGELLPTLRSYLDSGRSLEATARALYVHPNTVRYRLKRVSELIGWDATGARDALVLHAALIVGAINEPEFRRH